MYVGLLTCLFITLSLFCYWPAKMKRRKKLEYQTHRCHCLASMRDFASRERDTRERAAATDCWIEEDEAKHSAPRRRCSGNAGVTTCLKIRGQLPIIRFSQQQSTITRYLFCRLPCLSISVLLLTTTQEQRQIQRIEVQGNNLALYMLK